MKTTRTLSIRLTDADQKALRVIETYMRARTPAWLDQSKVVRWALMATQDMIEKAESAGAAPADPQPA